ncbi:PEP-CTERM sorting domain-containing protein [Pirellulales bacterium]|nr:PEP-CTERM sorting domain-containing protein [Pirellulales bacterium]
MNTLFVMSLKRSLYLAVLLSTLGIEIAAARVTVLHHFGEAGDMGLTSQPRGGLTLVGDRLYGTTTNFGGIRGTVYSIGLDGTDFTTIHQFQGSFGSGGNDLEYVGNRLYGADPAQDLLFSLNTDGSDFTIVYDYRLAFSNNLFQTEPVGELFVSGSTLYGAGTTTAIDILYSLDTTDGSFNVFVPNNSIDPNVRPFRVGHGLGAGPILLGDRLYGTTDRSFVVDSNDEVTRDGPVIYSVVADGTDYQLVHGFSCLPIGCAFLGNAINQGLAVSDGRLFGLRDNGDLFSLNPDGSDFMMLGTLPGDVGVFKIESLTPVGDRLYGAYSEGKPFSTISERIFSLRTDGTDFRIDHVLAAEDGILIDTLTLVGNRLYGVAGLGGNFGGGTLFFVTVPEPSSSLLILAGSLGLCIASNRRAIPIPATASVLKAMK